MSDVTYGTRDDGDLVNGPCGFLLEKLLNDEAADVPSACDCETSKVRHNIGWQVNEEGVGHSVGRSKWVSDIYPASCGMTRVMQYRAIKR